MTGLELLALFSGCLMFAAFTTAGWVHLGERRKQRFLGAVISTLEEVHEIESGDVEQPLSFRLGNIRVRAVVRGELELWQLERVDESIVMLPLAVVQREWRAPDVRSLPAVAALTPRLDLFAGDPGHAHGVVARCRAELCLVLGRRTKRCVVGPGRAFLELTRRGLQVRELADALRRLDDLLVVLAGGSPRILDEPAANERAVAGPHGAIIPGFG